MRFLSNGDYLFPFHAADYWAQHLFTWSFQHGAPNPDGILRIPGRVFDLLFFAAFGNVAFGYFYALSCLAIAFFAFWWFARVFLDVQRRSTALIGALFFALNPIFLGNISKVGLILAASMLLICLAAIKQGFAQKRFRYFLLYLVALNISLLHPFTFSVNLLASGAYLAWQAWEHRMWVRDHIVRIMLIAAIALPLNAYFLLPIASLGSIDKNSMSDSVSSAPVDYTSLVDIANTGDIFTGLSLSKGVLKDYEFYTQYSWPLYFLGVFALYAIMFGVYVRIEKQAKPADRRRFGWSLAIFLGLLVLSTATYLHADVFIKFLIGLPGGWMFRSPLKWQLYMPLALFAALVIALKFVQNGWRLKVLYASLGLTFVLMNGYLFVQIQDKLFTPRSLVYFGGLQERPLASKNLLFINATSCALFARDHPGLSTELNQVFVSNSVQVKRVESASLDSALLSQYDYVMGCTGTLDDQLLTGSYNFKHDGSFAENNYQLYKNSAPVPYAGAVSQTFAVTEPRGLGGKYAFTTSALNTPFSFVDAKSDLPSLGLQDAFDALTPQNMQDGRLRSTLDPVGGSKQQVVVQRDEPTFFKANGTKFEFSSAQQSGMQPLDQTQLDVTVPDGQQLELTYTDPAYDFKNLIANASFEGGTWQQRVGDCNAYDDKPDLAMRLIKPGTDGDNALELSARKHIACTNANEVKLEPGKRYLLHFDYQNVGGAYGGYYVGFNDEAQSSIAERLTDRTGKWQSITTSVTVPEGATTARLVIYAYPANEPGSKGIARYDNFSFVAVPDVQGQFFMLSGTPADKTAPAVETRRINPTKTLVHIKGANEPFYLTSKESYNKLWKLYPDHGAGGLKSLSPRAASVAGAEHTRMNSTMNGWYVTPEDLCKTAGNACSRNADGSYDIWLAMEFGAQRWFYVGAIVSTVTFAGVFGFMGWSWLRDRKREKGTIWR
jgi:hypothetical protein